MQRGSGTMMRVCAQAHHTSPQLGARSMAACTYTTTQRHMHMHTQPRPPAVTAAAATTTTHVGVRTKFTWPSSKRPRIPLYPPEFSLPKMYMTMDEIKDVPWVKAMFPDGNVPSEWADLEVKTEEGFLQKRPKETRLARGKFGKEFKGRTEHKQFLLDQFNGVFDSEVVLLVSMASMSAVDMHATRDKLSQSVGCNVFKVKNTLARRVLEKTKYDGLRSLFAAGTYMWYCDDVSKLSGILKVMKKDPRFLLVGGKVDGRIVSPDMIKDISEMPPLDMVRGETAAVLGAPASRVAQNIGANPQRLSQLLTTHASPPTEEGDADK